MTSTRIDGHYNANLGKKERKSIGERKGKTISVEVFTWYVSGTKAECHEFRSRGFHDGV